MIKANDLNSQKNDYIAVSLAELIESKEIGISEIFSQVDALVDKFPSPEVPGNDMGTNEKWEKLMLANPTFVYFLVLNNERIVGYWFLLPVTRELYDRGLRGENINKEITEYDIEPMCVPGDYYVYFVDLFIYEEHRGFRAFKLARDSFISIINESSEQGYYILKMFTHASTVNAIAICRNSGLAHIADHGCHRMNGPHNQLLPTKIYELDIRNSLTSRIFTGANDIVDRYKNYLDIQDADVGSGSLKEMIAKGESLRLEFKSDFKIDSDAFQILKTIAAFQNSEGGTLLVGVGDNHELLGINAYEFNTRDSIELELRNRIKSLINPLASNNTEITFVESDGLLIMKVICSKSRSPVYLRKPQKSEPLFFIRAGASTQKLEIHDAVEYARTHFLRA